MPSHEPITPARGERPETDSASSTSSRSGVATHGATGNGKPESKPVAQDSDNRIPLVNPASSDPSLKPNRPKSETPAASPSAAGKRSFGKFQKAETRFLHRAIEFSIESTIRLCGISAIVFVFAIFFFVFREAAPILSKLDLGKFFFTTAWYPTSMGTPRFGVGALIIGTLSVTLFSMALAVPFGLGAAVFVSEFCSRKTKEALKITIELLAAIPSVVWGFIGLTVMNVLIQKVFDAEVGLNVLNAGIILALMSVPIIVSIGEDALKAVPDSYREAAIALGATRWQLIYRVLLPAAKNGLLAAALLGVARAVGETMAVLMATGHSVNIPHSLLDSVRTLTATIASELGEASQHSDHYRVLFLIGVLLFAITFVVNLTADLMVRGIRKK
jgi:phosphate transport system permease protein